MNIGDCKVSFGEDIKLSGVITGLGSKHLKKKHIKEQLLFNYGQISNLQNQLFSENRQSLLIIFQGMDSAGKDAAITNIMQHLNPFGVNTVSFKHPTALEQEHDYLWRHSIKMPEHGQITIFNRSHYENVLISKVHPEIVLSERLPGITNVSKINKDFWDSRCTQINDFEKRNIDNGTSILKFFLHLSKEEQRIRFLERIKNKEKHWKFSSADITERKYWKEYQVAYQQAFKQTSTNIAPWYVIPADNKPYAHYIISKILLKKLKSMDPLFPAVSKLEKALMEKAKGRLKNETQ